jgi:ABC-type multidrug transport system fused ATPase/permease subunit
MLHTFENFNHHKSRHNLTTHQQEKTNAMSLENISMPSNRKFGAFFTFIFMVAGLYLLFASSSALKNSAYVFLMIAAFLALISAINPDVLLPLNKLWMRLGLLLGTVVSPIVLGLIFFGMLTPIAFLMRVFGRDELRIKLVNRPTYWKDRSSSDSSNSSFKNQF